MVGIHSRNMSCQFQRRCTDPNNRRQVLVLAAHPDDETLGCGATLKKLADRGHEIMLITFTDGVGARQVENTQIAANRNELLPRVCNTLGIRTWVSGNFPDNRLDSVPLLDLVQFIEQTLENHNFHPKLIFTHHPDCLNIDHSLVYRATLTAFRPQRGKQEILSYFVPSSTDYNPLANFQANVYYTLARCQLNAKIAALRIYHHEMRPYPHTRSYQNVENLMRVWGSEIGTEFAEKFQQVRLIR